MEVKPVFKVSVRDLVETTDRSGDINFRFSGRSSAMEGIRGHQRIQKSRGDLYEAEKQVKKKIACSDLILEISGRVDGYFPGDDFLVEEIKTTRVDVDLIPESVKNIHWGQARIYAMLLAEMHDVAELSVRLCYLDLEEEREHHLTEHWHVDELKTCFDDHIDQYCEYLRRTLVWIGRRNRSIDRLTFPYEKYRPGQREMAVSVYRTLKQEHQLVMQAPTGIGKTIAGIFPSVKALKELSYEKLFFLSAKTSGQQMAQKAISDLKSSGLEVRDITLTAKSKICFNPGSPCDADHCEYALGYYDRLAGVVDEALESGESLDRSQIEHLAHKHQMCPFELSLDLSLISDTVICDYNYVFDPVVRLRRYFETRQNRYVLLMDESHNLVDRGREMFSAEICKDDVLALRRQVKAELPLLARRLSKINTEFLMFMRDKEQIKRDNGKLLDQYPTKFIRALNGFCEVAEDWLQLNQQAVFQPALLELYFEALRIQRVAQLVDENYVFVLLKRNRKTAFKIFCLNPGPGLSEGFTSVNASICFSATMSPQNYFKTLMGIDDSAGWYQIESPFPAANLGVFTTSYISTTYRSRSESLYELVDTLESILRIKTGNYIVFFPSHAYLAEVLEKFVERYPEFETIVQTTYMAEEERELFLQSFESTSETLIGFAVMGGIFGEGIDLKGTRLIGAIIVCVGLPQQGLERDLIRGYFDADESRRGNGFEFAYQYPGMNRVLQTAGRVIRSETDRGIVCLIDHRFNEARYQALFPESWKPERLRSRQHLMQSLRSFWKNRED